VQYARNVNSAQKKSNDIKVADLENAPTDQKFVTRSQERGGGFATGGKSKVKGAEVGISPTGVKVPK